MKRGEKGDITKFTRDFWNTVVAYNGADETIIRDYDIKKDHDAGLSYSQLAIKYKIHRTTVIRICGK